MVSSLMARLSLWLWEHIEWIPGSQTWQWKTSHLQMISHDFPITTSIYSGFPIATIGTFDDQRVHMHTHTNAHGFIESTCV